MTSTILIARITWYKMAYQTTDSVTLSAQKDEPRVTTVSAGRTGVWDFLGGALRAHSALLAAGDPERLCVEGGGGQEGCSSNTVVQT